MVVVVVVVAVVVAEEKVKEQPKKKSDEVPGFCVPLKLSSQNYNVQELRE